ncbi:alpha/beta hydrolase [Nocardioides salsibiostraticola]
MSTRSRVATSVAGVFGLAAAGTAVSIARQRRQISHRVGEEIPFGELRSEPITVVAEDGVPLHVEVDELAEADSSPKRRWGLGAKVPDVTVVFVHGFCLSLDCWHFQRAAYRGLVRSVYYDQRSHGRSGQSERGNATIEQLARDLVTVLDHVVPTGPVVLIGHSMGGMTIAALAEQFPELIGDRVVGVGLVSTTAGGLDPVKVLLPMLPTRLTPRLTGVVADRAVSTLSRGHRFVDIARRAGHMIAMVATDRWAFGGDVPPSYLDFVDDMLSETPFEVVADFFPSFRGLDKFDHVGVLGRIPVAIVCGTSDRLTSIGHSRKLHQEIAGSRLLECEGAGHLVILERHDLVTAELDQLITAAMQERR